MSAARATNFNGLGWTYEEVGFPRQWKFWCNVCQGSLGWAVDTDGHPYVREHYTTGECESDERRANIINGFITRVITG